jgi:PKD-like domain
LNSTGNVYTTEAGMSNYTWTIVGGIITSGTGTNSVIVTWNAVGAQSISVTYTAVNGCDPTIPTVYPVDVLPLPATSPIWHN